VLFVLRKLRASAWCGVLSGSASDDDDDAKMRSDRMLMLLRFVDEKCDSAHEKWLQSLDAMTQSLMTHLDDVDQRVTSAHVHWLDVLLFALPLQRARRRANDDGDDVMLLLARDGYNDERRRSVMLLLCRCLCTALSSQTVSESDDAIAALLLARSQWLQPCDDVYALITVFGFVAHHAVY
jgi:hypothetical protein